MPRCAQTLCVGELDPHMLMQVATYPKKKINKQLNKISYEIANKKLDMLYGSVQNISNTKNLEDKYKF